MNAGLQKFPKIENLQNSGRQTR